MLPPAFVFASIRVYYLVACFSVLFLFFFPFVALWENVFSHSSFVLSSRPWTGSAVIKLFASFGETFILVSTIFLS